MKTRGFSIFDVLIVVFLLAALTLVVAPSFVRVNRGGHRTKCSNDLRQLGLAAVQYGDDKRFLPHVAATRSLDGDVNSSDTPRSVRAMVWYGYHDNPEGFVCPSSMDLHVAVTDEDVLHNMRLWGWSGEWGTKDSPRNTVPPWKDGLAGADPSLYQTSELSYAYTRRGYNRNVSSTKILGADRARRTPGTENRTDLSPGDYGNHADGWNVLMADCTVQWAGSDQERIAGQDMYTSLTGTQTKDQGHLPLSDAGSPLH